MSAKLAITAQPAVQYEMHDHDRWHIHYRLFETLLRYKSIPSQYDDDTTGAVPCALCIDR